ncbi:MAG: bifunctional oligoribonuclease/PAP phosphatase NrnA [Rikenellaceae bacterium]|nr:bifunctional oligoribonuclease/PAP phosphatase NrnA [Rikenellaceae bacterium]
MELDRDNISRLREMIEGEPCKITVVSHTNPDGDAIGSSLAWAHFLRTLGHTVECVVPNRYPYFLEWMPSIETLRIFKDDRNGETAAFISGSEIIFCLDFNCIARLEGLSEVILSNTTAKFVLVDHHLDPPQEYDLVFSHPECSSTSFLVYKMIEKLGGTASITKEMGESLFVGIMTDTGNFAFSNLTSDLFETVASLVRLGVDIPYVHSMVYNSFTVDRVKLLGYALNKMETIHAHGVGVAYITLLESELRRFHFQQGDSEGFVNYPLTVKDLQMSVIFIQTRNFIRVSLRSRGDVDVSRFAKIYFEGGGHRNASGGKSYKSMPETVAYFRKCVEEYFADGPR